MFKMAYNLNICITNGCSMKSFYKRLINPLKSDSFFLFGARGTGKTFWLNHELNEDIGLKIDLLDDEQYFRFLTKPHELKELLSPSFDFSKWIIIDEVQKIPALLNAVHLLIENKDAKFILTGSSARKLKKEGANLLAGRAFLNTCHPLTHIEIGEHFNLESILRFGALPKSVTSENELIKNEYLKSYVQLYIRQEIKEEQAVRNLDPFVKFLEVAAQCNGEILNFTKIGHDVGADSHAIARYYDILVDTLMGFYLEPFHQSVRKRQIQKAKFYLFDLGVKRALQNLTTVPLEKGSYGYGFAFEHFILLEIIRLNDYYRKNYKFSYLKTKDGIELDLIIERPGQELLLIEIKSTTSLPDSEISRLENIKKDLPSNKLYFLTQEKTARYLPFCEVLPWKEGIKKIFD